MAETYNTLNHLVQINDRNLADLEVTDLLDDAPLLKVLYTQTASQKTLHKYLKQTVASAAAFRAALDGVTNDASQDELVTVTLKILDGSFHADVALADAYKDGRGAYLQKEMFRKMRQIFSTVEKQVIYGVGNDAAGFIGLHDGFLNALSNAMVVAAGKAGSTADSQTSVYFIRHGRDDVSLVLGNDGKIVVEDEPTIQRVAGSVSGTFPALYVPVTGYIGLQLGSAYSSARIANVEKALDDDDIAEALALFPASRQPNVIVMNRKAAKLLRESRTATSPTGAPAPWVESCFNIPVIITDSVKSTEAVET